MGRKELIDRCKDDKELDEVTKILDVSEEQMDVAIQRAKIYLDKAEAKRALKPLPDLPAEKPLTPQDLVGISVEPMDLQFAGAPGSIFRPLDFMNIPASTWLKVLLNTGALHGRALSDLERPCGPQLLLPPNENLYTTGVFKPSQVGGEFTCETSRETTYSKCDRVLRWGVDAKVQTPYVSGSASYNESKQESALTQGDSYSSVAKVLGSIGTIDLTALGIPYNPELVNPEFVSQVEGWIDDGLGYEELSKRIKNAWGDVLLLRMEIGVAGITSITKTVTSTTSMSKASQEFKAAIAGGIAGFSAEVGAQVTGGETNEDKVRYEQMNLSWLMFGGTPLSDPNNPYSCYQCREDPTQWRIIESSVADVIPVVDLLPGHVKSKLPDPILGLVAVQFDGLLKFGVDRSFDGLLKFAGDKGMRLPTIQELRDFLDSKACPSTAGMDVWSPTLTDCSRDWIQIGLSHKIGLSHVENLGYYPDWANDSNNPHSGVVVLAQSKLPGRMNSEAQAYVDMSRTTYVVIVQDQLPFGTNSLEEAKARIRQAGLSGNYHIERLVCMVRDGIVVQDGLYGRPQIWYDQCDADMQEDGRLCYWLDSYSIGRMNSEAQAYVDSELLRHEL
jgi:hypothetical protein